MIREMREMSLLGVALTKSDKKNGDKSLYVEYHECDRCKDEYRVYLRSTQNVEEAFQELAKRLGNRPEQPDLCFNCQNKTIADQTMLPLEV